MADQKKKINGKGAPAAQPAKKDPVEFWFDFSSPYAYIASTLIDDIADEYGRTVTWRPFLLGVVFKETGNASLISQPLKGAYSRHDLERTARFFEVPFKLPDPFPVATQATARAFYWLDRQDPDLAKDFAASCLHSFFAEGHDISKPEVIADVAKALGADSEALLEAIQTPDVKALLKDATDAAIAKGVCGAPFFFVDGEPFWGADRLWMVEEWLESGGW